MNKYEEMSTSMLRKDIKIQYRNSCIRYKGMNKYEEMITSMLRKDINIQYRNSCIL